MKPGDLVFVMGTPGRPVIGTRRFEGYNRAEIIKHGTPGLVLDIELGNTQLLLGGMQLWVPIDFVKETNEAG